MKRLAFAVVLLALFCSNSLAQESTQERKQEYQSGKLAVKDPAAFKIEGKQIFSGPQRGEKVRPFKATILAGDNKGKEIDPIALAGDKPQILFFQDENGVAIRGLFNVGKAISEIERKTDKKFHVACVFLSDDADTIVSRFGRIFPAFRERGIDVISVSKDGRNGPGAFGLNRTVSQTIILVKNGKVTRNFVFRQGMLFADPHVLGGVAELIGEKRETVAKWLSDSGQPGDDPQAAAKLALRKKLGQFVEAGKITREEAGELYQTAFPERKETRDRRNRE